VPNLVCLSDVEVEGVETIPLKYNWPKWWSKLELFSDAIDGDLLYIDLDTVVLGDLAKFEQVGETTMLSDFYNPQKPASGLMYIAQADKAAVWNAWISSPEMNMAKKRGRGGIGDQGFLAEVLKPAFWQEKLPSQVASYKVHCKHGVPDGVKVVCFHGNPRPWSARLSWVPELVN
jgi:hypothetical protein